MKYCTLPPPHLPQTKKKKNPKDPKIKFGFPYHIHLEHSQHSIWTTIPSLNGSVSKEKHKGAPYETSRYRKRQREHNKWFSWQTWPNSLVVFIVVINGDLGTHADIRQVTFKVSVHTKIVKGIMAEEALIETNCMHGAVTTLKVHHCCAVEYTTWKKEHSKL